MRKKILYMAVAAIAVLSSCSNDELSGSTNSNGEAQVFTGFMENESLTSKSTLADGSATGKKKVFWESTDKVTINGVEYTATPDETDSTKAKFTTTSATGVNPPYKAAFQLTENGTGYILPASYTYTAGKFNMPMYAESETTTLGFQNVCGVFAIKVTNAELTKVTGITVTSNKDICGGCTILKDAEGKYYASYSGTSTDDDKKIAISCGDGVETTAEGTTFYVPLLVVDDANLYVTIEGTVAETSTTKEYKDLTYTGISIKRNMMCNSTAALKVSSITLNKTSLSFYPNGSETLIATVSPDKATTNTVAWSSSNESVATVDQTGKVTAKAVGTATITASATDGSGISAACAVTVNSIPSPSVIKVTSITLNKTSTTLATVGTTETLTATIAPSNATNKTLTWTSSDENVATVDQTGKVTAKAVGTATITATATDGSNVKAECNVTVGPIDVNVTATGGGSGNSGDVTSKGK